MSATPYDGFWTQHEGASFCAHLEEYVSKTGYHVGLMGSVLIKGASMKDLDVILYPRDTTKEDPVALGIALREAGLSLLVPPDKVAAQWKRLGSNDKKKCMVCVWQGKRVDVFLMS